VGQQAQQVGFEPFTTAKFAMAQLGEGAMRTALAGV